MEMEATGGGCKKGIVKFSRTPILENISERLLLQITIYLYLIFP